MEEISKRGVLVAVVLTVGACAEDTGGPRSFWESPNEQGTSDGAMADETGADDPTLNIANRPNFLLPFPCDSVAEIVTYVGHNPDDKKMDIRRVGMPTGSPILAASSGLVHEEFYPGGIEIRHGDGWFTTYMHMKWHVAVGTWVEQGDVVGEMGNVGSPDYHLHHEQLYAAGQNNAHTSDMVNPVIQGQGPFVLVPNHPFKMKSINCGHGELEPYGAIGTKWHELGGAASVVGEPIRAEDDALFGGRFQDFENGMIIWHPDRAPEAWAVHGRIFELYRETGSEDAWGFPTMDEMDAASAPDGTHGRYQYFEDALFLWSGATDAHVVSDEIHDAFVDGGRETALGYPTGDAEPEGDDGLRQTFQAATIHWSPEDGASIE